MPRIAGSISVGLSRSALLLYFIRLLFLYDLLDINARYSEIVHCLASNVVILRWRLGLLGSLNSFVAKLNYEIITHQEIFVS